MRGVIKASMAAARAGAFGGAAGRGADLLSQARDAAAAVLRNRRDPSVVAERRRVAARRRLVVWLLLSLLLLAGAAGITVTIVRGGVTTGTVAGLVVVAGLFCYSAVTTVHGAFELHRRTLVVRQLPAPQPHRRAVTIAVRSEIVRLDGYSDALRVAIGSLGATTVGGQPSQTLRALRDDTLSAADAAEVQLRDKAAELTALSRAANAADGAAVAQRCRRLTDEITAGVAEYGRLVVAASDAAAASHELATQTAGPDRMAEVTERLTALAHGMRDLVTLRRTGD